MAISSGSTSEQTAVQDINSCVRSSAVRPSERYIHLQPAWLWGAVEWRHLVSAVKTYYRPKQNRTYDIGVSKPEPLDWFIYRTMELHLQRQRRVSWGARGLRVLKIRVDTLRKILHT